MTFHEFYKEGETVSGHGKHKGMWEVIDVRAKSVTLIPIVELVEHGALKRKCDFTRKPIVLEQQNFYGGAK